MTHYQPLHQYEHLRISRYCMVSVLMSRLHAYSHLSQTLFSHTSDTFWSIGLACEVTRPHTPQLFLVGAHEEHGLLAKNCRQQKKLCSNSCSPLTAQGQKVKLSEKTQNSLLRPAELCVQVAEVIPNTNQCKVTENLRSLILSKKNFFFSYVVTKYINLHSQLTNVTKNLCLSYVVLCDTQFSFDAAHIVEYNLTAAFVSLCYKNCHFVFNCTI